MKRIVTLAIFMTAVGGVLGAAPASAVPLPDPVRVSASDDYVRSTCQFNPTAAKGSILRGRLTATSQATWAGFKQVTHIEARCFVNDSAGSAVAHLFAEGARAAAGSQVVTVPLSPTYEVCLLTIYQRRGIQEEQFFLECAPRL